MRELLGRAIVIGWTLVALRLSPWWWAALVVAPFVHKAYDRSFCYDNRIQNPHANFIADVVTFAISFAYIVMATVLFGRRFGSWYGWASGLAVGLFFAQGLGVLWPRRWYSDEMESRWRLF